MSRPRVFTDEELNLAREMRSAGHLWKTIEPLTRPGIRQAVIRLSKQPARRPPTRECSHCGEVNHVRRYFCKGCGVITQTGKDVK